MAKIYIDDKEYEVDPGKNLLEVCLSLGYDLTYFCWHPAMHSVGACRQCGVIQYKDENDTKGKLVMACMQPASDNTRISLKNAKAADFRAGNIESLMINHPHDCPVCDEGGECHLQDMTLMSGHNYRRYRFKKRTHVNQYLGPFIYHEMNRCIQCYRCVRFYNDYAGGHDFGVFASKDNVYFGRSSEGTLENEFSGNLVEVCPTGVFTDKSLRQHYTRKWDLTNAPSICHQCSVGCNTIASERYNGLRRILSRYNGDVNGYFICDRGRFGYEYVNSPVRYITCRKEAEEVSVGVAIQEIKEVISDANLVGIGSPRASLESNYMLKKLVGGSRFFNGVTRAQGKLDQLVHDILNRGKVKTPSLAEMETCDAVFVLGEDVTNTAPMMALALRQAAKVAPARKADALKIPKWNDAAIRILVQNEKGPFYSATAHSTKLDEIATKTQYLTPGKLAALSTEMRDFLGNFQPDAKIDEESFSQSAIKALMKAEKPLIVSGTSLMSEDVIKAAANIAYALKDAGKDVRLAYAVPEANSMGMTFLTKNYLEDAFEAVENSGETVAVILENDLYERTNEEEVTRFLQGCKKVIVLDSLENKTTLRANYILPAGTFAESDGTMVNNEGRAQRFYQVYAPKNEVRSSWSWLDALEDNGPVDFARTFDIVVNEMADSHQPLQPVVDLAPAADYRIGTQKIPREPHRYSGRTAMNANIDVHEPKPPQDPDSPLSFTMEGYHGVPPSPDVPFYWAPGWNSVQSMNKYQTEVGGPLKGGNPGKRLFEPDGETAIPFFDISGGNNENGKLQVIPMYHIYGSDELSAKSPPVAERIPEVYLAMNSNDGAAYAGKIVEVRVGGKTVLAPVKIDDSLPQGYAGMPKGLNETKGLQFPLWPDVKISAKEE